MKIKPLIIIRIIGIFAMLMGGALVEKGGIFSSAMPGMFIAGIGMILRQNWARWMGLFVFGSLSLLLLVASIASIFMSIASNWLILSMIVFSSLFGFCFWLLTRKEIVAEFKRKGIKND